MQGHRNAELGSGAHERQLEIRAKADRDVGLRNLALAELLEQAALLAGEMHERRGEGPGALAVKARHMDRMERKARLRDCLLYTSRCV